MPNLQHPLSHQPQPAPRGPWSSALRCLPEVFNAVHHLLRDELSPAPGRSRRPPPRRRRLRARSQPRPAPRRPARPMKPCGFTMTGSGQPRSGRGTGQTGAAGARTVAGPAQLETRSGSTKTARASDAATSEHDESWAEILLNAEQTTTSAVPGSDGPVSFTPVTADTRSHRARLRSVPGRCRPPRRNRHAANVSSQP